MHEGFVNYNAGTLGTSMVEGRISAGVVVDDGSDIGGGASIMGTLSGGGKEVISVGKRCLLGANSGIGISLGDDCVIEAGLYVTGGTKVTTDGQTVKAKDLSGANNVLFRRNSVSGAVEVVARDGRASRSTRRYTPTDADVHTWRGASLVPLVSGSRYVHTTLIDANTVNMRPIAQLPYVARSVPAISGGKAPPTTPAMFTASADPV